MAVILTEELLHQKTPQELTAILYEACIDRLQQAVEALNRRQYIESNRLLQNCNDILYRLGAGINYDAGIIADQLEAVYNYMAETLIKANIHKDARMVSEVLALVKIIADSWKVACTKGSDTQSKLSRQKARAYDQDFHYENSSINHKE